MYRIMDIRSFRIFSKWDELKEAIIKESKISFTAIQDLRELVQKVEKR